MPEGNVTTPQEEALKAAVERLADEFRGSFNAETIDRFVTSSYERLATGAEPGDLTAMAGFVRLTERFAHDRLQAQAKVDGAVGSALPSVLFLCIHNTGRSQMALGWFHHLADERALAWSAGSDPGPELNEAAVAAMAEVGIDISAQLPKPWADEVVQAADVVVTMGCGDACPVIPGKRYEDWALDDPKGKSLEEVRPIRDEIGVRVRDLLERLGVNPR
jgi:arsenate reductase (thioredoxin)